MKLLRLDRLVTTGLVHPALQAMRRLYASIRERVLPILMYHSISDDPEPGVSGYYRLNTPPTLFRDHLKIIRDEGFTAMDLTTAWSEFLERTSDPMATPRTASRNLVALTFDDGYRDFLTNAWPALEECGYTATMFLPTAFIGREPRAFKNRACLTWEEIRGLRQKGVEFGSHTVSHPKLCELDQASLELELGESRRTIEQELGEPVATFAHPYAFPYSDGAYVHRFREALHDSGYHLGVTTSLGRARPGDDRLLLKRLPVNGADDAALFRAKLHGAYDWLAKPQALFKRARSVAFR